MQKSFPGSRQFERAPSGSDFLISPLRIDEIRRADDNVYPRAAPVGIKVANQHAPRRAEHFGRFDSLVDCNEYRVAV